MGHSDDSGCAVGYGYFESRSSTNVRLIGLVGHAGAGKSSVAKILVFNHGFVRLRFADTLKSMLKVMGLTDEEVDGNLKETPCKLLGGKTPRYAMQTLGTAWGREKIYYNLWVNAAMRQVGASYTKLIVLDDVRFGNEALAIKEEGGEIWRVQRPEPADHIGSHPSEVLQDQIIADRTIRNNGSLAELAFKVTLELGYGQLR